MLFNNLIYSTWCYIAPLLYDSTPATKGVI